MNLVGNTTDFQGWRMSGCAGPAACMGHGHKKHCSIEAYSHVFLKYSDATSATGGLWLYRTLDEVSKEAKRAIWLADRVAN